MPIDGLTFLDKGEAIFTSESLIVFVVKSCFMTSFFWDSIFFLITGLSSLESFGAVPKTIVFDLGKNLFWTIPLISSVSVT